MRPTVEALFAADLVARRRGQADAHYEDAAALDALAEILPAWVEELGLEEACARLRLAAGTVRARADQLRGSAT